MSQYLLGQEEQHTLEGGVEPVLCSLPPKLSEPEVESPDQTLDWVAECDADGLRQGSLGKLTEFSSNRAPMAKQGRSFRYRLQRSAKKILKHHRIKFCTRSASEGAVVSFVRDNNQIKPRGLQYCGCGWVCPVCAPAMTEEDRLRLRSAVAQHKAAGGQVGFLTLTVPHPGPTGASLARVLKALQQARSELFSGRFSQDFRQWVPIYVTALEVTYGEPHGWHPHLHMLLFLPAAQVDHPEGGMLWDLANFDALMMPRIKARWAAAVVAAGLPCPSDRHGVVLQDGTTAADYVQKWGAAEELAKAYVKTGRRKPSKGELEEIEGTQGKAAAAQAALGRRTPWQILSDYAETPTERDADLFREFARCFKGRHRLRWSNGGLDHFNLKTEQTPVETIQEPDLDTDDADQEQPQIVATLPAPAWDYLCDRDRQWDMVAVMEGSPGREQEVCDRWLAAVQRDCMRRRE